MEAGATFQNWLLTANDQMLIMPRKPHFLNGLSEVPPKEPGGFTGNWAVHTGIPSKIGVFPTKLCIAERLVS